MLILIIVLIIFGAGKIPQLGEGLGKAIKGFKKSVAEADALDITPNDEPEGTPAPPPPQQVLINLKPHRFLHKKRRFSNLWNQPNPNRGSIAPRRAQ